MGRYEVKFPKVDDEYHGLINGIGWNTNNFEFVDTLDITNRFADSVVEKFWAQPRIQTVVLKHIESGQNIMVTNIHKKRESEKEKNEKKKKERLQKFNEEL